MTMAVNSGYGVQHFGNQQVQKAPVAYIERKKSKAPAIGAAIGAGIGVAGGAYSVKMYDALGLFKNLSKTKALASKAGLIGLCVAGCAAGYATFGAVISLFTRNSRKKAAVEEYKEKLNTNV